MIGLGFVFTGGIVIHWLTPSLFKHHFTKSRRSSRHYHHRRRQLLRYPPDRRHRSSRVYYQLRRYKEAKHASLIAHNRLVANFNGPWGSSEQSAATTSWAPELGSAASDLFGTPAAWHHELQTNENHFVDPIQQIRSLKILSAGTFLATELHRKHIRWKGPTRRAMVAAATFIRSQNLTDLTNPQQSPTPRSELTALSQRMTVYLSDQGNDLLPIVIDSGASISLTANYNDFVGPIRPATITELQGLSHTTKVHGVGQVKWTVRDVFGTTRIIKTQAYYVPEATVRLFSPQTYFREQQKGHLQLDHSRTTLELHDGSVLHFPYNATNNLPLMLPTEPSHVGLTFDDATVLGDGHSVHNYMSVADESNQNLTRAQKELLLWHWKLGHANLQWIQTLCREPTRTHCRFLLDTHHSTTPSCVLPKCAACMLGKQTRRRPGTNTGALVKGKEMMLRREHLQPGDCVSLDQYESSIPGRLPHTYGKEKKDDQYNGGTLFIDHASSMVFIQHQVSLRTGETLQAKHKFEQLAREHGVTIKSYHADNSPFGNAEFVRSIEENGQAIKFSGVGAHHQNGVAERTIKTISSWARTMLLHATIHWPEQNHLNLWPYAFEHAVFLWNNLPGRTSGVAPLELFTGVSLSSFDHLQRSHVWGCPAYVLDPKLQDGKKLPKWQARARRGQYLGVSPDHSSTIGRILNLRSGFISPQYHVIYDDLFSTVPNAESGGTLEPALDGSFWRNLIETGYESLLPDGDDADESLPDLHPDWLTDAEIRARQRDHRPARLDPSPPLPVPSPSVPPSVAGGILEPPYPPSQQQPRPNRSPSTVPEGATTNPAPEGDDSAMEIVFEDDSSPGSPSTTANHHEGDPDEDDEPHDLFQPPNPELYGRGKRRKRPSRHLFDVSLWTTYSRFQRGSSHPKQKVQREQLNTQFLQSLQWNTAIDAIRSVDHRNMENILQQNTDPFYGTVEEMHPFALATKADAADNPTWEQAMNRPDSAGYWEACKKELNTLADKKNGWDVVERQPWMNILPSTWAFRCKRYSDGSVRKLKARFCARGDKQVEGVDYFDTFAPVINWTTVRLMLILTLILNLSTCQVDYTAAFVHSPIDRDPNWENMSQQERDHSGVYLEMPRGFAEQGKALKLRRSLYGLKQSPRNFFQHLKGKLEAVGLRSQDHVDPCLFMSDKVIVLVYVDGTLFYSP